MWRSKMNEEEKTYDEDEDIEDEVIGKYFLANLCVAMNTPQDNQFLLHLSLYTLIP